MGELVENAADGPHVDLTAVVLEAEEDFGGSIPESDDFVSVGFDGDGEGPGEAEVCDFDSEVVVDEDVLRLDVSMDDAVGVTVLQSRDQLVHDQLHSLLLQLLPLILQILFQVLIHEVEYYLHALLLVNYLLDLYYIRMLQLLY